MEKKHLIVFNHPECPLLATDDRTATQVVVDAVGDFLREGVLHPSQPSLDNSAGENGLVQSSDAISVADNSNAGQDYAHALAFVTEYIISGRAVAQPDVAALVLEHVALGPWPAGAPQLPAADRESRFVKILQTEGLLASQDARDSNWSGAYGCGPWSALSWPLEMFRRPYVDNWRLFDAYYTLFVCDLSTNASAIVCVSTLLLASCPISGC